MDCEMNSPKLPESPCPYQITSPKPMSEAETIKESEPDNHHQSYDENFQEYRSTTMSPCNRSYCSDNDDGKSIDGSSTASNFSTSFNDQYLAVMEIRDWVRTNDIPAEKVTSLLNILKRRLLPIAPASAESLMFSDLTNGSSFTSYNSCASSSCKKRGDLTNDNEFKMFVISKLVQMSSDIKHLKNREYEDKDALTFTKTYNLSLPISNEDDFNLLNNRIYSDSAFNLGLCYFLKTMAKKNDFLLLYLVNTLRTFLTEKLTKSYCGQEFFTGSRFAHCLSSVAFLYFYDTLEIFKEELHKAMNMCSNWDTSEFFVQEMQKLMNMCSNWNKRTKGPTSGLRRSNEIGVDHAKRQVVVDDAIMACNDYPSKKLKM